MRWFCWIGSIVLLLTSASAWAQLPLQPVDQAVGDLDLLSTSLRRREVGLRLEGQETSLFEVPSGQLNAGGGLGATGRRFYLVGQGFQARVSRMDYLVRVGQRGLSLNIHPRNDGEFMPLIPPDTVFELTPLPAREIHKPYQTPPPNPARLEFLPLPPLAPFDEHSAGHSPPIDRIIHRRGVGNRLHGWDVAGSLPAATRSIRSSAPGAKPYMLSGDPRMNAALSQPLDYRLDYRVNLTTGEGFTHQLVTPVDLRPILRRRALRRQRLEESTRAKEDSDRRTDPETKEDAPQPRQADEPR